MDVSVALGKLRPHLLSGGGSGGGGGSKKFPRACGLLADLLSAKLGDENEEVFFDAVFGAVERAGQAGGGSRSGSGSGGGGDSGSSGNGDGVADRPRTLLRADGAAGEAVRRLVKAACSRSAVFSHRRRETVEAWGKEMAAFDATENGVL